MEEKFNDYDIADMQYDREKDYRTNLFQEIDEDLRKEINGK